MASGKSNWVPKKSIAPHITGSGQFKDFKRVHGIELVSEIESKKGRYTGRNCAKFPASFFVISQVKKTVYARLSR